jgi:hypothetical protein
MNDISIRLIAKNMIYFTVDMETTEYSSVTKQTRNDSFYMDWLKGDEWKIYECDQLLVSGDAYTSKTKTLNSYNEVYKSFLFTRC